MRKIYIVFSGQRILLVARSIKLAHKYLFQEIHDIDKKNLLSYVQITRIMKTAGIYVLTCKFSLNFKIEMWPVRKNLVGVQTSFVEML